jgi:integrase
MMQQFFFYPHILDNLAAPDKGFDVYQDMKDKRLRIYVTARGIKTFFIRKRVRGKDVRIILGNYPKVSIDDARTMIDGTIEKIVTPKKSSTKRVHFSRMVKMFMADKIHRIPKSEQKLQRTIDNLLAPLMTKYINEIKTEELINLNDDIAKNHGCATANRMREFVKSMYSYAIMKNIVDENPAAGVEPKIEKRRQSKITNTDLKKIISKIHKMENPVLQGAFLMLIYGFMQKTKVFSMNWNDLDFKHDFYGSVPLSDKAAVLLKNMPQSGKWIFPNGHGSHIVDPRASWEKLVHSAGLEDVQMNDCTKLLRRQLKWSGNPEVLRDNMNSVLAKFE